MEVVSLCDVDRKMMAEAAEMTAARQTSRKKPRTYGDYREMLAGKDLDIVIVGTPDHWHALPTIAALEAGADVDVQKPISMDVAEGQAMVAAARKHNRVVQVGTQRRSTPHLIEAGQPVRREVAYKLDQYPEDRTEKELERHIAPVIRGHMKDFLKAIASRGRPVADIEDGHISTASCILANLAMQLGRTLTWDADKGQVVCDAEANRLLRRPHRAPWNQPSETHS